MQNRFCYKCGAPLTGNEQFCPNCGTSLRSMVQPVQYTNQNNIENVKVQNTKKGNSALGIIAFIFSFIPILNIVGVLLGIIDITVMKDNSHGLAIVAIIIGLCWFLPLINSALNSSSSSQPYSNQSVQTTPESPKPNSATQDNSNKSEPIAGYNQPLNIGESAHYTDDCVISLLCVRKLDELSLATGYSEEIDNDKEIIYLIFDVGNLSSETMNFTYHQYDDFSLNADGIKASGPDTSFLISIDGYQAYNFYKIDSQKSAFVIKAYEVDKGWDNLNIYFDSKLLWRVRKDDVSQEPFNGNSVFKPKDIASTEKNETVYSGKYRIIFDGFEIHKEKVLKQEEIYAIFKFTIENTSTIPVDLSSSASDIRGYRNDHLLDSPSYLLSEKIDSYTNLYDIDTIQPGETVKGYIAFEINDEKGPYTCVFNVGSFNDEILARIEVR